MILIENPSHTLRKCAPDEQYTGGGTTGYMKPWHAKYSNRLCQLSYLMEIIHPVSRTVMERVYRFIVILEYLREYGYCGTKSCEKDTSAGGG
jgi:hypothetical protein